MGDWIRKNLVNNSLLSYIFKIVIDIFSREAIQEDDDGLLDGAIAEIIQKAKRKRQTEKTAKNRLGMMRHLYIILDCSESMVIPDLKPTRMICTLKVTLYFDCLTHKTSTSVTFSFLKCLLLNFLIKIRLASWD